MFNAVTTTSPHKAISGCCTTCAWLSGAFRVEIWMLTWSSQLNIEAVNDAYNSILIDEEDYNTLRDSMTALTVTTLWRLPKKSRP